MTPPSDYLSDMASNFVPDDLLGELLSSAAPGDHHVVELLNSMKEVFTAGPAPHIGEALGGIIGTATAATAVATGIGSAAATTAAHTSWIATVTAKVALGATVAAASVGGAHTAGIIDVPIFPKNEAHSDPVVQVLPEVVSSTTVVIVDPDDLEAPIVVTLLPETEPDPDEVLDPDEPVVDDVLDPDEATEVTEPDEATEVTEVTEPDEATEVTEVTEPDEAAELVEPDETPEADGSEADGEITEADSESD